MYAGCGKHKGCVGEPKLCLQYKSCHSILTYNQEEQKVKFQIMGRAGKYAAIALSRDDKMVDGKGHFNWPFFKGLFGFFKGR